MGVKGLTSFVRDQPNLGQTVTRSAPTASSSSSAQTPLIVDAHALLYNIAFIDPVRGGQFKQVRALLERHVSYWRACGLVPEFVFDGVSETTKHAELIARCSDTIERCNQYMSEQDEEEEENVPLDGRSLARRLPALTLGACVAELRKLGVPLHFAEGEADAGAAELVQRKGGYVLSSDSDFFIYAAQSLGYIPLLSIKYGDPPDSFLLWEHTLSPATMTFRVYQHTSIASGLDIPPAFLPILGALAGNDHSDYSAGFATQLAEEMREEAMKEFEEDSEECKAILEAPLLLPPERVLIPYIAAKLRTLAHLAPSLEGGPTSEESNHLLTIIQPALCALGMQCPAPETLSILLASIRTYALLPLEAHSPTFPLHPQSTDTPHQAASRALYLAAFKRGELLMSIPRVIKHRIEIRAGVLEIPQRPSAALALGRPIADWVYAVLADALFDEGELVVTEYQRHENALVTVDVSAPSLRELVREAIGPRFQWTADKPIIQGLALMRFQLLLKAFGGLPPGVPTFANPLWPLVLALRHIKRHVLPPHAWQANEFAAALATGAFLLSAGKQPHFRPTVPAKRAFIQRSTELISALSQVQLLAEALLVSGKLGEGVSTLFDGRMFHALLGLGEEGVVWEMGLYLRRDEMEGVRAAMRAVMTE